MREAGGLEAVTLCLPTFLSTALIVGPQHLPVGRVRNGDRAFFELSLEFLGKDNTKRTSLQRNELPKEVNYRLKIHDKCIKAENESQRIHMLVTQNIFDCPVGF